MILDRRQRRHMPMAELTVASADLCSIYASRRIPTHIVTQFLAEALA
jgi:hypothetical protein